MRDRSMRMRGGMILLSHASLHRANLLGLARLAEWLHVQPSAPWRTDGERRHNLIQAIMREEKRLAKLPKKERDAT